MAKHPYRIVVKGEVACRNKGVYGVLLNIFEEVKCKFSFYHSLFKFVLSILNTSACISNL